MARHVSSKGHLDKGSVTKISTFLDQPTSFDLSVIRGRNVVYPLSGRTQRGAERCRPCREIIPTDVPA